MNIVAEAKVAPYHKGIKEIPSQEYLRECFDYRDGWLYWKRRPVEHFVSADACNKWGNKMAGKRAGHISSDGKYIKITIGKSDFYAQRIIWTWHYGVIPPGFEMDHIDGNGMNNVIENLRLATVGQNMTNRSVFRGKKSGLPKGVTRIRNVFQARIVKSKKVYHLGYYQNANDAAKAYCEAANSIHGEFVRKPAPPRFEAGPEVRVS